jgi:2-amino-4-hydroxy-6-hydroxymethyldihydropteridine diphosphokinase
MSFLVLSLGSNLGKVDSLDERKNNLQQAIELLLKAGMKLENKSSIYETEPEGIIEQPKFLNLVLGLKTELSPQQCLKLIHQIELNLRRLREVKNGPRTIDLDIIFYDQSVVSNKDLVIPHPRMHQRASVLVPLAEILPNYIHPVYHKTAAQLLAEVNTEGVKLWN